MFIESLQITSFASLNGFTLDLTDGVNVVRGSNEAGKSTISEFIRYVLYGFNGKSERERYLGFSSNTVAGSLILRDGDKRYRIERKTVGAKDACEIYDLDTGSTCFEGRVPGEVFFGMPSGLFTSTVFVGQTGGSSINGKSASELLDNLLFAADEGVNVKKSLKKLDEARIALLHKNKKGGRIFELENELSSLDSRLDRAKKDNEAILSTENKLKDNDNKLEYVMDSRDSLACLIEDYRLQKSREKKERLNSLEDSFNSATAELSEHRARHTRNGFFPDQAYLESLRTCASEVVRSEERGALIEKRLENLHRDVESDRAIRNEAIRKENEKKVKVAAKRSAAVALAVVSIVFSIISTAACAFTFILGNSGAGAGLGALSALLISAMITGFVMVTRYSAEIKEIEERAVIHDDGFEARLDIIREELDEQRREKERYSSALKDLCARWSIVYSKNALSEMVAVIEENRRLENEVEKARVAYVQMKTEAEENRAYEPEDDGREISLPEDFDYRNTDRSLKLADEMIRLKQDAKHQYEIKLAQLGAVTEAPFKVMEEIAEVENELGALKEKYSAVTLAYEKIEAAAEKMRLSVSPKLSRGASEKMAVLTNGKYDEIGVDSDFSMTFRPVSGEGRVTKDQAFMSAGTSDIAYVSLRLSLSELICGALPPTVFDESFSRLDDERLLNMLRLLASQKGQIILLTSNRREEEMLKNNGISHYFVNIS